MKVFLLTSRMDCNNSSMCVYMKSHVLTYTLEKKRCALLYHKYNISIHFYSEKEEEMGIWNEKEFNETLLINSTARFYENSGGEGPRRWVYDDFIFRFKWALPSSGKHPTARCDVLQLKVWFSVTCPARVYFHPFIFFFKTGYHAATALKLGCSNPTSWMFSLPPGVTWWIGLFGLKHLCVPQLHLIWRYRR